jgi:hypothetical protein
MSCNDECAVEKAEAKEFAFFSGIGVGQTRGAEAMRQAIIKELKKHVNCEKQVPWCYYCDAIEIVKRLK